MDSYRLTTDLLILAVICSRHQVSKVHLGTYWRELMAVDKRKVVALHQQRMAKWLHLPQILKAGGLLYIEHSMSEAASRGQMQMKCAAGCS